jgi:hypothetical protein
MENKTVKPQKRVVYGVRPTNAVSKKLREVTIEGRAESYSSYIARVLADHFGLPHFDIEGVEELIGQTELPLKDTA